MTHSVTDEDDAQRTWRERWWVPVPDLEEVENFLGGAVLTVVVAMAQILALRDTGTQKALLLVCLVVTILLSLAAIFTLLELRESHGLLPPALDPEQRGALYRTGARACTFVIFTGLFVAVRCNAFSEDVGLETLAINGTRTISRDCLSLHINDDGSYESTEQFQIPLSFNNGALDSSGGVMVVLEMLEGGNDWITIEEAYVDHSGVWRTPVISSARGSVVISKDATVRARLQLDGDAIDYRAENNQTRGFTLGELGITYKVCPQLEHVVLELKDRKVDMELGDIMQIDRDEVVAIHVVVGSRVVPMARVGHVRIGSMSSSPMRPLRWSDDDPSVASARFEFRDLMVSDVIDDSDARNWVPLYLFLGEKQEVALDEGAIALTQGK